MDLNFNIKNNSYIPKTNFLGIKRTEQKSLLKPIPFDSFVKSVEASKELSLQNEVQQLFDATYDKVLWQNTKINPILKDVEFNKPKLEVLEDTGKDSRLASYSFTDNTVTIKKSVVTDNMYILCSKTDDGKLDGFYGPCFEKDAQNSIPRINRECKNLVTIKLSPKEKELYLKTVIAHELRHFIQGHLALSSSEIDKFREIILAYQKTYIKDYENYASLCREIGEKPDESYLPENKFSYVLNYKPKKQLDKDATLKYSMFSSDNRRLSVNDHFVANDIRTLTQDSEVSETSTFNEYLSQPSEVDAYNYESEFFATQMNKKIYRKEVTDMIYAQLFQDKKEAEEAMIKSGLNFIE